jgi:HPt (histidine-containing phosphotransfer) domain-containing protein
MDGYLAKPIRPAELHAAIDSLDLRPADPAVPPENSGAPSDGESREKAPLDDGVDGPFDAIEVFDREDMRRRLGGDEALLREILELFAEDAPLQLRALREGVDASNTELVVRHAHILQGQAANISAARMREVSLAAEAAGRDGDLDRVRELLPGIEISLESLLAALREGSGSAGSIPCGDVPCR